MHAVLGSLFDATFSMPANFPPQHTEWQGRPNQRWLSFRSGRVLSKLQFGTESMERFAVAARVGRNT